MNAQRAVRTGKPQPNHPGNPIFHWPVILRHLLCGALPLIVFFLAVEKLAGESSLAVAILLLAAIAPLIAVGWLAWQNLRKR